jgi:hypothetical protein
MQSKNYVPGVSGWKFHEDTGEFEIEGTVRLKVGAPASSAKQEPKPFVVVGGVTYINQALIARIAAEPVADKLSAQWSVKMQITQDGKYVAAGVGVGLGSDGVWRPDIIVKPASIEFLSDGTIKIKQSSD